MRYLPKKNVLKHIFQCFFKDGERLKARNSLFRDREKIIKGQNKESLESINERQMTYKNSERISK